MSLTESRPTSGVDVPAATGVTPYVPDDANVPEFTWSALLLGTVLGIVFGASSLYLVLKVGLTVSASIPVAVLSLAFSRGAAKLFGIRRATILENNIVQTTGSAGESVAFGVGVTMPALMLLGFEMNVGRVMVVSVLGGLLGILMMIPLRRAFIVRKHHELKYPEGTACARVLVVGEQGGASAKTVFFGFAVAFVYQILMQGMRLWRDIAARGVQWFPKAVASIEVNPTLLGVGYIIGPRVACIMVAGGVLASFVIIPAIAFFGQGMTEPLAPATMPIAEMEAMDIWNNYVLYIGAGAVAAGGIISLVQALPLIGASILSGVRDLRGRSGANATGGVVPRTDRDLPMSVVAIGSLGLVIAIWSTSYLHQLTDWIPDLNMHWIGAVLIVLFGFLFVTVSSRLTGEIGSSSNPISGMTVATLLLTCLIFYILHRTAPADRLTALTVAAVVCIAASNGGTTSQDLKTGYLVGATPLRQQLAILIGAVSSALIIGWILVVLNSASTVYSQRDLPELEQPLDVSQLTDRERAPKDEQLYYVWRAAEGNPEGAPQGKYLVNEQGRIAYLVDPGVNGRRTSRDDGTEVQKFTAPKAQLMALVTDGILTQKLPWTLVLLGVAIAVVLELCKVPSLPFAVGVYLPLFASTPIFVGGMARYVADRWAIRPEGKTRTAEESDMSAGVLLATGYIAGGALGGVLIAFLSFSDTIPRFMAQFEHRHTELAEAASLPAAAEQAARRELGVGADATESEQEQVDELAAEIEQLNSGLLPLYVRVPAGTTLEFPRDVERTIASEQSLGEVAREHLGNEGQAALLLSLNDEVLEPAESLPAGVSLKLPQKTWPAVAMFSAITLLLVLVGLGWLFRTPELPIGAEPDSQRPEPLDRTGLAGRS